MGKKNKKKSTPAASAGTVPVNITVQAPAPQGGSGSKKKKKKGKTKLTTSGGSSVPLASASRQRSSYIRSLPHKNGIRLQFCELVQRINSSTATVPHLQVNHSVNPSNFILFPRLATIARAWEKYSFKEGSLQFHFQKSAAATRDGTVLMYFDYDPVSPPVSNYSQIVAQETHAEVPLWQDATLRVNVKSQVSNRLYLSTGIEPTTLSAAEVRQGYLGSIRLYSSDATTASFCGYLWVEGDVILENPVSPDQISIIAASNSSSQALVASQQWFPAMQQIESQSGVAPPAAVGAGAAYTADPVDGVVAAVDAVRTLWDTGSYLVGLWDTWSGASSMKIEGDIDEKDWDNDSVTSYCPISARRRKWRPHARIPAKSISHCRGCTVQRFPGPGLPTLPAASGDLSYCVTVLDASTGVVDPNFPASITGMTVVETLATTFIGTDPYAGGIGAVLGPIVVPPGKSYILRPFVTLGATTGRTATGPLQMMVNRFLGETVEGGDL